MRRHNLLLALLLFVAASGYGQQTKLSGKVHLDTSWARKFYISRLPGFDQMFTASRALIIAEGDIDVKTHVNNIYAKLGVNNRKDLDRYKDLTGSNRTKRA